jgi:hypothetical protein
VKWFALAAACLAPLPGWAETPIRAPDGDRLAALDANFGASLRYALAEGAAEDVRLLAAVLEGVPGIVAPEGEWACRTLKLGGGPPLTVYGNFRCRITYSGPARWRLVKETGSQRMEGEIIPEEPFVLYLGVGYVQGGPATDYAGLPPLDQTPVEPGQTVAQVGVFEQMGPNRARLLLPAPLLESDFDILYLTR